VDTIGALLQATRARLSRNPEFARMRKGLDTLFGSQRTQTLRFSSGRGHAGSRGSRGGSGGGGTVGDVLSTLCSDVGRHVVAPLLLRGVFSVASSIVAGFGGAANQPRVTVVSGGRAGGSAGVAAAGSALAAPGNRNSSGSGGGGSSSPYVLVPSMGGPASAGRATGGASGAYPGAPAVPAGSPATPSAPPGGADHLPVHALPPLVVRCGACSMTQQAATSLFRCAGCGRVMKHPAAS
jgi:hypothetical protein